MTIDEAIMIEKYYGKKDEKALKELQNKFPMIEGITDNNLHEQIAEWLELLKWYQQGMEDIPSESGVLPKDVYRAGYIKAIEDFAERLHDLCGFEIDDIQYPYLLYESRIDEIAEQLKAGGTNG